MAYSNPAPLAFVSSRLSGRVIVVTGASSGIGAAAALLFAREGAAVVALARRKEALNLLVHQGEEEGLGVSAHFCDVTNEDSVVLAIQHVLDRHGRLDGAFNNAGAGGSLRQVHEIETEDFDRVIATNLRGTFLCMKHEIRAMLQSGGGAIVNTSSLGGLVGGANYAEYSASKWGLAGLTKSAALDYARQGIRVNAIAPGPTDTEMFRHDVPTEEARTAVAGAMPMNYIAHPEDVARAALFLLSDESRWTTGAILPCEGGAHAG